MLILITIYCCYHP